MEQGLVDGMDPVRREPTTRPKKLRGGGKTKRPAKAEKLPTEGKPGAAVVETSEEEKPDATRYQTIELFGAEWTAMYLRVSKEVLEYRAQQPDAFLKLESEGALKGYFHPTRAAALRNGRKGRGELDDMREISDLIDGRISYQRVPATATVEAFYAEYQRRKKFRAAILGIENEVDELNNDLRLLLIAEMRYHTALRKLESAKLETEYDVASGHAAGGFQDEEGTLKTAAAEFRRILIRSTPEERFDAGELVNSVLKNYGDDCGEVRSGLFGTLVEAHATLSRIKGNIRSGLAGNRIPDEAEMACLYAAMNRQATFLKEAARQIEYPGLYGTGDDGEEFGADD